MESLYNTTSNHAQLVLEYIGGYGNGLVIFPTVLAAAVVLIILRHNDTAASSFPIANPKKWFELSTSRSVLDFALAGREVLLSAREKFGPKPFRIHTDMGTFIMLRPEHGEEVRNDPCFSVDAPAIEGHPTKPKLRRRSLKNVLRSLAHQSVTQMWKSVVLGDEIKRVISKMSARIFVGPNLSNNERWLELVVNYGNNSIEGVRRLRLWPRVLKSLAVHLIPKCRNLQAQVKEAWDFLMLAVVAMGTTVDLITQALVDTLRHPELIQPLREEAVAAISDGGWKKTLLYNMKLLDSVLNESQRLKPNQISSMFRQALVDVTLSDGMKIPKGHQVVVSTDRMRDPSIYENPEVFDGYRFIRMREEGQEAANQLVTTSINHLGFGHGEHGCPGRFFAANEAKIVISQLLLKYDMRLESDAEPVLLRFGFAEEADPNLKVLVKRREEEIAL
ncbi:trichothecene c-8 hydroxylase cytochrome p450 monooxygenase [Colletotrichum musicola]|uniref:Trichothecene c-8 hydroxylase cytochrome p450 monooxygenase n=1 Tax=Colletotrichum musicola TaxID=2175873 RepID=A0A8H6ISY5_9PEZI|nr:trichothecene c-8 hydroxylase cytochrome p450 monooxygenase [Colletotrichum musicola]